jgi:hypothetical protein
VRRVVFALVVLAACSRGQDPTVPVKEAVSSTTSTTAPESTTSSAAPTTTPPIAPAQPATATCPAIPARGAPAANRPTYQLDLTLDLERNVVEGREVVRFTPDLPTGELVFRLWPNGPRPAAAGARLDVGEIYLGSSVPSRVERPDPTTIVVPLDAPLSAGQSIEATVPFTLTLPTALNDRTSRRGDSVRLGTFHPLLAWEPGIGWGREPPTSLFAEATTAPVADWSVSMAVPDGLTVLAPGVQRDGRWYATALREFAMSIGRFRVVEGQAGAPQPVPVTVAVEESIPDDPNAYLDLAVRSLTDFGVRFGPYPYDRYTLTITPDLSGGIEYPSFVHQGPRTLTRTTPHEVGHMWFYALVGNNQARDPWLDEGLATWAEARFLGNLDSMVSRSIPADGRGRVAAPMTYWDAGHGGAYYRSVYVQGAQALAALGDPDRVDCALRLHIARAAHAITSNAQLLDSLDDVFPDARAELARFGVPSAP